MTPMAATSLTDIFRLDADNSDRQTINRRSRGLPERRDSSGQQTGPPAMEAVGKPVLTNGAQARDVIVDVMDIQRD